jgi:hypothetical protein
MQIGKFKHQHGDIKRRIAELRDLARAGADTHAEAIAQGIVAMSALIGCTWRWRTRCCTRRCRPTARAIWPGWRGTTRATWCRSLRPTTFARRWNTSQRVRGCQGFRDDANLVLRKLHERMLRRPGVLSADRGAGAGRRA